MPTKSCYHSAKSSVIILKENKFQLNPTIVHRASEFYRAQYRMRFTVKPEYTEMCSKSSAVLWQGRPGTLMEFVFINMKCLGMFDFSVGLLSQA